MVEQPDFVAAGDGFGHVTLVRPVRSVKANPVVPAAHQRNIFGVRPAQRHGRAGGQAAFHFAVRQVVVVPKLLGNHVPCVGEFFDGLNVRQRVASRRQFVMARVRRSNRPGPAHARAIESAAVGLLPVAVVIVAPPARPLRQIPPQNPVDHFNGREHDGIVRRANAEADQLQKISAHDLARRMQAAAVGDLNHGGVRIGVRVRRLGVGRD
jgi:hypothetical protein